MTNCKQCNQEVPEEARFCPNCGSEVQANTSPTEAQPYRYDPSAASSGESGSQATGNGGVLSRDERNISMLIHLSSFAGLLFPFANIIAPLVIWLMKREDSPFIDAHGKAALNFQISVTIYAFVSAILILAVIGIFLLIAVAILDLVLVIIAAVRANEGSEYRYPLAIPFPKVVCY